MADPTLNGAPEAADPVGPQERLRAVAEELVCGSKPDPVRVRTLLSWFGAERRGYGVVQRIRSALHEVGLKTEPDFESVYIDSYVVFKAVEAPRTGEEDQRVEGPTQQVSRLAHEGQLAYHPAYDDPTYRLSKLPAANQGVVSVSPDASLQEAITVMLSHDFSQLPVMTTEREVKGALTWQSIGTRLALGRPNGPVRDFMDPAYEISSSESLFAAIPIIALHQYVLVRSPDRRVVGIVTASDLSLQFQQLAEPFLLIGEIENHLRRILSLRLSPTDLVELLGAGQGKRPAVQVSDLTFGDYVRLFSDRGIWEKLGLRLDRRVFVEHLEKIRDIRNDVMHFDPDGIPESSMLVLRRFASFLRRLQMTAAG